MLHRYLRTQKGDSGRPKRRPYLATLCEDLGEAEHWLREIGRDIRHRITEIQNPNLGEERVRELNDALNKLLRERIHWTRRVAHLGGTPPPARIDASDADGDVFEHRGYYYFGAARELPGVVDIIRRKRVRREEIEKLRAEESTAAMYKRVGPEYYGSEPVEAALLEVEEAAEREARSKLVETYEAEFGNKGEFGRDAEWDCSFLDFVGKKPLHSPHDELQMIALERKKRDALEQLEAGMALRTNPSTG